MSLLFKTPPSENISAISVLAIRIGIAFGFLWAGFGKVTNPEMVSQMLQQMVGLDSSLATNMTLMIGSAELLSGILVLIGLLTRPAAIFQIIILIGSMVMFGFDFTAGPAIWKDPALLGVAIMLLLYGSGKFGLDYRISKTKHEEVSLN
jgi:putative oxidoreductase